jgi:predicted amidohydrolase YtcJ
MIATENSSRCLCCAQVTLGVQARDINEHDHPSLWLVKQNVNRRQLQGHKACAWLQQDRRRSRAGLTQPRWVPDRGQKRGTVKIVHNAKVIHTVSEPGGYGAASAFVIIGDRIAEVCETDADFRPKPTVQAAGGCSLSELLQRYPSAVLVDARNKTIIPGLIDSHVHLRNVGEEMLQVDLRGASSKTEVIERIRHFIRRNPQTIADGGWLRGARWDQTLWHGPDTPFPTRHDLDTHFPGVPIYLTRVDGHGCWVSSAAINASEATTGRPLPATDPPGGQILRLPDGVSPSGVFLDDAMKLIRDAVPPLTDSVALHALALGVQQLNRWGLTGVHDAGETVDSIRLYRQSVDSGNFTLRNYVMCESNACGDSKFCADRYLPYWGTYRGKSAWSAGNVKIKSVKFHLDGALGSYGAVMLQRYSHLPQGKDDSLDSLTSCTRCSSVRSFRCLSLESKEDF